MVSLGEIYNVGEFLHGLILGVGRVFSWQTNNQDMKFIKADFSIQSTFQKIGINY